MKRVYLDYNASTPIAPEAANAMRPYLTDHYGNPSSRHWAGTPAKEAVEHARGQVADLLGCLPEEIVFTSGGTESNNHAPNENVVIADFIQGIKHIATIIESYAAA